MSPALPAAAIILAFLIGAIPCSFLLAKLGSGVDIRTVGSGNVGATNLARSLGLGRGLVGLLLDAGKGAVAVLMARAVAGAHPSTEAAAGAAAVLGHIVTPFLSFKGGKGVATGAGAFAVLAPGALLVAVGVFALATGLSRMVSLGSVLAAATLPLSALLLGYGRPITVTAILVGALVIARHRQNLARIIRGKEHRLGSEPDRREGKP